MRSSLSVPLIALLLAGCAGPHVETAKVAPVVPPEDWRTPLAGTAALEAHWWRGFGDPALTALVERALANNLDIGIAGARIRSARAQELAARAALLPNLEAGAGAERSRSVSGIGTPLLQSAAEPLVQTAWEIDLFGRLADQRAAARSAWEASEAARDAVRLSVASTVASGYVTLLALDARLSVARQTVQARKESLDLVRRRADAGYSPRLELAQSEAEYQAALQTLPPLESAAAHLENALRLLTGDLPGAIAGRGALGGLTPPAVPSDLPSGLLRRRPDVAQAELQLAATDHALAAARKRFLPQVRLSASGGAAFSTALADTITLWSIGGSILAPLFEGGRLRAGAESAAADRDAAAFAYRKTALNAFREVDDALDEIVRADRQLGIIAAQRDALAQAFQLASNRYHAGYSPYLEQLDAQRGLLAAELGLVQAKADTITARIALYQAMGGGWRPSFPGSGSPGDWRDQ